MTPVNPATPLTTPSREPASPGISEEDVAPTRQSADAIPIMPFLRDPIAFLKNFAIFEDLSLQQDRSMEERLQATADRQAGRIHASENPLLHPGIFQFQFIPSPLAPEKLLRLTPLLQQDASGEGAFGSASEKQVFRAYWLPWQPDAATKISLGPEADYFFTSQGAHVFPRMSWTQTEDY